MLNNSKQLCNSSILITFHSFIVSIAMTSHPSRSSDIFSTILKFEDVKYSVGITNLSSYKNTEKFTCEHDGLYLISASVLSSSDDARYFISLNGNSISHTYIGDHSGQYYFTGAVTVSRKLNPNVQVWLETTRSWNLYGGWFSEFTIIKIK